MQVFDAITLESASHVFRRSTRDRFRVRRMLMLAILSLLLGLVLGQRFRVLVLIPVIIITLLFAVVAGLARADKAWTVGLTTAVATAGLQIGYLLGIGVRLAVLLVRRHRRRAAGPTRASPQRRAHEGTIRENH
jgi:hypothetical protein